MGNKGKILVVDDNAGIRTALKILLSRHFEAVELTASPAELISRTKTFRPDAVLLDMNFHTDINTGNEGLFWLSELKRNFPRTAVVLFTAYADIDLAVEGMKRGAFDFIVKPWDNEKLISTLKSACGTSAESDFREGTDGDGAMFWGSGTAMTELRRIVEKTAGTDASILITGENGTGKDLLAREIHRLSGRSDRQMVSVDAGAIPETLFESELFGHVKGAFTDAATDRDGKFIYADGGTLFLDEIGNIPPHLQAKLLRVLQDRSVTRVGDNRPVPVDIRLICATNMNIEEMVADGRFREDLFYRINTVSLRLPPLRERKDEIKPLTEFFIRKFSEKYRRNTVGASPEALSVLQANYWSGNIRELQNCIERAVIMSDGPLLQPGDLDIPSHSSLPEPEAEVPETIGMAEAKAIKAALEKYDGNLSLVAKALGISRPTLYNKLKKYGL